MRIVTKERTVFFDIDDTLVMHREVPREHDDLVVITDPLDGVSHIKMLINRPMVRLLKEEYHRGSHVVVWSRGGYEWAAAVIDQLGLREHVDTVMTKPYAYFDDKPVEEWFTNRVYILPEIKYKK